MLSNYESCNFAGTMPRMKIPVEHIIALLSLPRIGRKTAIKLLDKLEVPLTDWKDLMEAVQEQASQFKLPVYSAIEKENARATAEKIVEQSDRHGIRIISFLDENYPALLKETEDFPVTLSYKGNIQSLDKPNVAIIGTRDPSDFGLRAGERLGEVFASNEFNVVSGLAKGIDASGHKGAIKGGGTTTAVMAHGLDTVYPKENRELADDILANDGVMLSEYFVGEKARGNYFVERDRIQAGLAHTVIVIETDVKGGTMHTVQYCLDYHRNLACIDHPDKYKEHPKAQGNRKLIQEGKAYALHSENEINQLTYITFDDYFDRLKNFKPSNKIEDYKYTNYTAILDRLREDAFLNPDLKKEFQFEPVLKRLSERFSKIYEEPLVLAFEKIKEPVTKDQSARQHYQSILSEALNNKSTKLENDFIQKFSDNTYWVFDNLLEKVKDLQRQLEKPETPTDNAHSKILSKLQIPPNSNRKNKKKDNNQIDLWE